MEHYLHLNRRDDVEPSSAAGLIEDTYASGRRPSFQMRQEIAPHGDPRADDPGSQPHANGDDILSDSDDVPAEDMEGLRSRKPALLVRPVPHHTATASRRASRGRTPPAQRAAPRWPATGARRRS